MQKIIIFLVFYIGNSFWGVIKKQIMLHMKNKGFFGLFLKHIDKINKLLSK